MESRSIDLFPALGAYALSKLRPLHIQSFYSDALFSGRKDGKGGLSAQTVLHYHRVFHKALSQAVKWQMLARNPADAVEPPRPQSSEMKALDDDAIAQLLRHTEGTVLHLPVLLALTTGMRRGEILGLRWKDLDLATGRAIVVQSLEQTKEGLRFKAPKTRRSARTIVLPGFTVEALKAHKVKQSEERLKLGPIYQDHGLICSCPDGQPWPPDSLSTLFAATIRRSSLPRVRFHDLRHTHATQLLKQGTHPKIVSERLGHSQIGITLDTYSHVLPGMQEEAIGKLDKLYRDHLE